MFYLNHWLTSLTTFTLLLVAYAAIFYLLYLVSVFVVCVQRERAFRLTPELWLLAAGCGVYLLTWLTWHPG
jgi:hypothetical protein